MRVHHTYLWIEYDPSSKLSLVHAIKKFLFKYVWSISAKKISFIWTCDREEIKAMDCIIKVSITRGNIKWRSFALRYRASNHKSTWQPLLPSTKGLSFIFTLCKSHGDLHLSFLHFILWQAQCVGKILIYISNWM